MDIPSTISISKRVRDQFQTIKNKTGVTNNVLSRIAIALALESNAQIREATREDAGGQTLPRDLMFGEHVTVYDVLIRQFMHEKSIELPMGQVIGTLIEVGAHKMGHCRSMEDLCALSATR